MNLIINSPFCDSTHLPKCNLFGRDVAAETAPEGLPMRLTGRGAEYPAQLHIVPGVQEAAGEFSFHDMT